MSRGRKTMKSLMILFIGLLIAFSANAAERYKKIVLFHDDVSSEEVDNYVAGWKAEGASVVSRVPFINGVILEIPDTITSAALADDYRVASVEDDQSVELQAIVASADGGAADGGAADGGADVPVPEIPSFISDVADNIFNEKRPWSILRLYEMPYDPWALVSDYDAAARPAIVVKAMDRTYLRKINIAIFDTGVDYTHPRLDNYTEGGTDLVNMTPGIPMDDNGHGTHVAATIVGRRTGLARGIKLYAVKVLDEYAMGDVSTIIQGIRWAINHDIDIINMSIAFRDDNLAVHLAIKKAYEAGIIMVGAVGNHSNWDDDGGSADGGAADGGASGDDSYVNPHPVMYPAAYPEVIAVGSHDEFEDVSPFSNTGPEMDLVAPGNNITSANLMTESKYGYCNGTSMATPHVTGAIALMLSLDRNGVLTTPDEIRAVLKDTSDNGRLNLVSALENVDMSQ